MKGLTVSLFILSGVQGSFAQEIEIKKDTLEIQSQDPSQLILNPFKDNWFVTIGAGAQHYFGDHNRQAKVTELITPYFGINIGKWFSPNIGVRAGVGGFTINGLTQNDAHSEDEVYDASQGLEIEKFNYYHLSGDVMYNVSNLIGGYKEDRIYNLSPYVGLGWMVATDEPIAKEISANLGLYNSFKVSDALDVVLDVRGAMVNDRFDGELGKRKYEGILSALAGVNYKFKKRNWEGPKTKVIKYDEEQLRNLIARVEELSNDNESLKKQLENAQSQTITDIQVQNKVLAAPVLITFPINQSEVPKETRVNLGFFAKVIKTGSPDIVYKITGYADMGTGTEKINEELSKKRAQAVYNILVNEFGISASQLRVVHAGGVENMFYDDPRLSRAVITMAEQ